MADVSVFNVDADLFGSHPKIGGKLYELYTRLSHEKKTRLKALSKISKEGVGFRQRKIPGSPSVEASVRTHLTRAEKRVQLYRDLVKLLDNPETKEILKEMILKEKGYVLALRELQTELNAPEEKK